MIAGVLGQTGVVESLILAYLYAVAEAAAVEHGDDGKQEEEAQDLHDKRRG